MLNNGDAKGELAIMENAFLISFGILIISATIMTYIFGKLKQPSILAFIVTGVLIGPSVFGFVSNSEEIILLSEIGIAFLLFSVGISTELNQLKKLNAMVLLIPIINILFTFIVFVLLQHFLAINFIQCLYFTCIISFSSTMLVAKILLDNFQINSLYGKLAISVLLVEDLVAVLAIPILKDAEAVSFSLIAGVIVKTIILIAVAYILNKFVYPKIVKNSFKSTPGFFLLSISSCFLFILFSQLLEFPIAVGSFIGGLAISIFPYNLEVSSKISGIRSLLSMIFFVSLGMQLSFNFASDYVLLIFLFLFVFLLKPLIYFMITLFSGYGPRISSQVAMSLAQVSEFSLILAIQGLLLSHITQTQYSAIVIVTSLSMVLTPYIMKYNDSIFSYLKPVMKVFKAKHFTRHVDSLNNVPEKITGHIVVIGSDIVGDAIVDMLWKDKAISMIIVDSDPEKVIPLIKKGVNCVCGDMNNEEVINSMNLADAKLVVVTVPRSASIIRFLGIAREKNPNIIIYTRANTKSEALKQYEQGSDFVLIPKVMESNFLLDKINNFVKLPSATSLKSYRTMYIDYLKKDLIDSKNELKKVEKKIKKK